MPTPPPTERSLAHQSNGPLCVILVALFLSGIASIANQVVWQRGLKIFLGGSETISSMVVILAFMLGLALGAAAMANRSGRLAHPFRVLGLIELALFVVNLVITWLLSLDPSRTIYAIEGVAVSAGVPLRLVYACGALAILLPPTLLMGATLPAASEACQRQLGATRSHLIAVLFFLNTLGAGLGAFGSSFVLLPFFGQRVSLVSAAACNLVAACLLLVVASRVPKASARQQDETAARRPGGRELRPEEILGTGLGFLSLGYEMYLLRLMVLAHGPLPYAFATTLCFFLVYWSIGVFLASFLAEHVRTLLVVAALLIVAMPVLYNYDRWHLQLGMFGGRQLYFVPSICFGLLYGHLVSRSARDWGSDVGRFYALNTLGSCLGIVAFTLVGYEIKHDYNALLIAIGLIGLLMFWIRAEGKPGRTRPVARIAQLVVVVSAIGVLSAGLMSPFTESTDGQAFWGRDGVVEVRKNGDIFIDSLWHSRLSDGTSHIGNPYNWMMVFAAVLSHRDEPMTDGLVVGNGVGITATTLAKLDGMHVDAYEINGTLRRVLDMYPQETLHVADNPQIDIRWQDARSGLALDPKEYDLIISAPLQLKQAGSSILLSREYMQLVRRRLKKNGVFALYSYEDSREQALLVRRTVASVFKYADTFYDGVLTVASDTPIEITPSSISARLKASDAFYREAAELESELRAQGDSLYASYDAGRLSFRPGVYTITDDHPLVEYPKVVSRLVSPESHDAAEPRAGVRKEPPLGNSFPAPVGRSTPRKKTNLTGNNLMGEPDRRAASTVD